MKVKLNELNDCVPVDFNGRTEDWMIAAHTPHCPSGRVLLVDADGELTAEANLWGWDGDKKLATLQIIRSTMRDWTPT